jgi:hypothetical protein
MKKLPAYTTEQTTQAERLDILGWLEGERHSYERQLAHARGAQRDASEACVAVVKDAIATLRAKWNMEAAGG